MGNDRLDSQQKSRQQAIIAALIMGIVIIGVLSVKRIVNGNADLSGNYRIWLANLSESTQPGRHMQADSGLQDPDSYLPITYAIFAPLAILPLPLIAVMWYLMNVSCTVYLWKSLSVLIDDTSRMQSANLTTSDSLNLVRESKCDSGNGGSEDERSGSCRLQQEAPLLANQLVGAGNLISNPFSKSRILILVAIAVLPSWIGTVLLGQHTLLQMSLIVSAFRMDVRIIAGALKAGTFLAFSAILKVLPVVFLLPFLIRGRGKVLASFAVVILSLFLGLGSLFFGIEKNREFHARWLQFAIHGPENRTPDPRDPNTLRASLRDKNQSIEAVLARLLMDIPINNRLENAPRVNLASVSPSTWRMVSSSLTAACVLIGGITILRSKQADTRQQHGSVNCGLAEVPLSVIRMSRTSTVLGQMAILSLMQLFISPVVWSHYYVWLVLPLTFVLTEVRQGRSSGIWIFVAWFALLPTLGLEVCRAIGLQLWMSLAIYVWICWPAMSSPLAPRGDPPKNQ